jgi:hypothetical protein
VPDAGPHEVGDDEPVCRMATIAISEPDDSDKPAGVRENKFENVHAVRCVQIVQLSRRFVTIWHGMDAMGRRWTGLRAWSGITGWRFESSSAHRKALQCRAFRV